MSWTLDAGARLHEQELWRRLSRERDQAAREELVALYLPMARRMAARYAGVSEPYDDLFQVASLGLLNAVDRYHPDRGTPFAGFAKPTILGELKRYFRDKAWAIRVPRALHDRLVAIETMTAALTEELSRPPTPGELAGRLHIEVDDVLETLAAKENRRPLGIDAPTRSEEDDGPAVSEWLGREDGNYELVEDRVTVETVLPGLSEREREIMRLRFVEELPQSQIAARVGCSQMQISRTLRSALDRMREETEAGPPLATASA